MGPSLMATDVKHAATPTQPTALAAPRATSLTLPTFLPGVLAIGAGVGFATLTCWMAFASYAAFHTGRFDLEIYAQVVWNIANGHGFATTLLKSNLSHLAEHVALVLVPIAGLYRLLPDPRLLLAIQQIGLALLGWPLFVVGRRLLGAWAALLVVVCFYLTPSLAGVALDDFHAVPLAALPLAASFALILLGRPRLGAGIALLALPAEEETALFVIGLGALLWLRHERRLGLIVSGIAAAYLALIVLVVMPSFHDPRTLSNVEGNRTLNHFQEIRSAPAKVRDRLFGERGRDAAVRLLLPIAGLGLVAPQTLLPVLPSVATLLLQDRDDTFGRHWVTPILVGVWMATIVGLARLPAGTVRNGALGLLVIGTAFSYRLASPLPGGGLYDPAALSSDDRTALLRRAVERVPASAIVVASPNVVAHLANRPEAYVFPIDSHYAEELGWRKKRPDLYVLDLTDDLTNRATNSERLNPLNADKPFNVWSNGRKVMVLSDTVDAPSQPLDARWADRLLLKGYDVQRMPAGTRVILYWERYGQLRGRYDRDLTVLDRDGATILYEEDMALSDVYGSNKWQPGQTILDEVLVPPASGPVTLRMAWVSQDKRSPFRLADGSAAFDLTIDAGP
jgi:uncharacterized membrane protein